MKIQIDAKPIGPLSLIRELPDAKLSTLEGLNGIGKTLAIRLLELCVGDLPYPATSPAFASLCASLGPFAVTAVGLKGNREIKWEGDSRDWPDSVRETGLPVFRRILIDGQTATFEDVRARLTVVRLAGDEGIVDTLAAQADTAADLIDRASRRVADREAGPLATLERAVAEGHNHLGEWTRERYSQLLKIADDADRDLLRDDKAAKLASDQADEMKAAVDLARLLDDYRKRAPDLERKLLEVDESILQTRSAREATEKQIGEIASRIKASEPLLKELRLATRTLERNRENLTLALTKVASSAAALRIEADAATIEAFMGNLLEQIAQLRAKQRELDAAPAMVVLLDDLTIRLSSAERNGLGPQIALEDDEIQVRLSVAQTRAAMSARKTQLIGQPPPPQAREVAKKLTEASNTLNVAQRASQEAIESEKYRRLVEQSESRLERALGVTDPNADSELKRLQARRREYDDHLFALASRRANLREQLGPTDQGDLPALERQLQGMLAKLGVTRPGLEQSLSAATEAMDAARLKFIAARDRASLAKRDIARATSDIQRAATAISQSPELDWLRIGLGGRVIAGTSTSTADQVAALDSIRAALDGLLDRLGHHRIELVAVAEALRGSARHLRGKERQAKEYIPEVQAFLGIRFSQWFNNERVKSLLLPKATGPISVDIESRQVSWAEGGLQRSRPLEAFSSGEQAFAYTRARLAVLDDQRPRSANRLIVLDEFGAFIAHDWLAALLTYLRERALEQPDDQVLVILPLSRDYEHLASTTVGEDAKALGALAEQVRTRRYAVQIQTN